jgi:predicted nucleic acid-binding protein
MILVDTSVWIELLGGRGLRPSTEDLVQFVTCGPIIQEVVQGLRPGRASESFRDGFLAMPKLSDPLPAELFLESAEIYRDARRRGITVRSSTDCLIAAIGIANSVPVWHRDRDFTAISRFTRLRVIDWKR